MIGQVIRVVEAPISLSISVARKSVELSGRVAGWALTEIVRQISPGRRDEDAGWQDEAFPPAADEQPAETVAVMEEEPETAVSVVEEEPEAVSPTEAQHEVVPVAEEPEPEPVGRAEPSPIGGEDGAVVEHEPGIGTSVRARDPHSALNNPVTEADLTEWPDPYDQREDPRDPGEEMVFGGEGEHTQTGATSTSEPHPSQDPEAEPWEGPKRDKVDR
jgi:hypothetical protein